MNICMLMCVLDARDEQKFINCKVKPCTHINPGLKINMKYQI